MFVFNFFLVRVFPHFDWIQRDTPYLSVFTPNAGKHGSGHFSRSGDRMYLQVSPEDSSHIELINLMLFMKVFYTHRMELRFICKLYIVFSQVFILYDSSWNFFLTKSSKTIPSFHIDFFTLLFFGNLFDIAFYHDLNKRSLFQVLGT